MKVTYLMNPHTGSVMPEADWRADMSSWEPSEDGLSPQQQFECLVEVEKDRDGNWVEPVEVDLQAKLAAAEAQFDDAWRKDMTGEGPEYQAAVENLCAASNRLAEAVDGPTAGRSLAFTSPGPGSNFG